MRFTRKELRSNPTPKDTPHIYGLQEGNERTGHLTDQLVCLESYGLYYARTGRWGKAREKSRRLSESRTVAFYRRRKVIFGNERS